MIGLITVKNPKSSEKVSTNSDHASSSLRSGKSRLVAKWLLDDQGRLYCQWIKG